MAENIKKPQMNKNIIVIAAILIIGFIVIYSGYFTVEPDEAGVVLRLGKFDREVGSGFHFKIPFVEEVIHVSTRVRTLNFGFSGELEVESDYQTPEEIEVSYMLTGDLNIVNLRWSIQYVVNNPADYLFNVDNVEGTIRAASETILRREIGDLTIDEVISQKSYVVDREAEQTDEQDVPAEDTGIDQEQNDIIANGILLKISTDVAGDLQILLDDMKAGVQINQVLFKIPFPPANVKEAYDEVNRAQQDKKSTIYDARKEYSEQIELVKGEAERIIQEAIGKGYERINIAEGEVYRYGALLIEYEKNPSVTSNRLYLETMTTILQRIKNLIIMDENQTSFLPFLNLSDRFNLTNQ